MRGLDWSAERIVVTGGAGFIGSHVVEELVRRGAGRIRVIDDLSRGCYQNLSGVSEHVVLWQTDLSRQRPSFPERAIVFHLAAKVASIQYNATHSLDMLQDNLAINLNVASEVARSNASLFVSVSTACVYPHDAPVPTPEWCGETCNPEPTNFGYGVAKWVGEQQARLLHAERGIPSLVVRFFNAIGPRDYYDDETSHVTPALIKRVLNGDNPIVVWGTGQQTRALVDARDIARALVDLAETDAAHNGQAVNIGHQREVSMAELAKRILMLSNRCEFAKLQFDTARPDGYPRRAADSTRLRSLIGWIPDTPLSKSLADMIADYRERFMVNETVMTP